MSFWSRLWDTPEVISKGVDAAIKTGDALVFTEEERAEYNQRVRDWLLKWQQATSGQNLARRLIAIAVTTVWLVESIVGLVLTVVAAFHPENSALSKSAAACWAAAQQMSLPAGVVLTFYFAPNKIGEAVQRYQDAKSKK
ncbi:hypothetical protein [Microbulbifer thermotolerans]|uniref:hypothetical protein n=1 Tax=Microbulbifer thermotolerans TaxID=252514 RepID=UPI00224A6043|nr:hypothetical protein [Microbulbifer thermotolerans]MCX2780413.1 hypothetical protein [Microbulbifer thermotolerans]MCX2805915.1 hypothetical protein [Microbulbifer thermotolerans]